MNKKLALVFKSDVLVGSEMPLLMVHIQEFLVVTLCLHKQCQREPNKTLAPIITLQQN